MQKAERLTYSVPEAAAAVGINHVRMYELAKRADFPAVKIGRRIVIPKAALQRWLETQAWKEFEDDA